MAAKEKWTAGDVPAARQVLAEAFAANPDAEAVWLAAFKLEFETGQVARARAILAKARAGVAGAASPRIWMKAAILERAEGEAGAEAAILADGIARFPAFAKLHLMHAQAAARAGDIDAARAAYAAGYGAVPSSAPLWVGAAALEEAAGRVGRARALLEQGRLANPACDDLWIAAIRTEARSGQAAAADALLAKALQARPASGPLWAEAIGRAPRPVRKARSVDALTKCNDDPAVLGAVAALFASDRKVEKARAWYGRATSLAPLVGDAWAAWARFEARTGGAGGGGDPIRATAVSAAAAKVKPKYGHRWAPIAKDPANAGKGAEEVLALVVADMEGRPDA
jgi:pre-mRNA-processing factor 6